MSLVTINDIAVISGIITMPLVGVWNADLVIDQPDGSGFAAGTEVAITSADGFTLNGVVAPSRTGDYLDAVHIRALGGAGGMGVVSTPRSFAQPGAFCRDIVNGVIKDSGETLSTTTDTTFLGTNLIAWAVMDSRCAQVLKTLIDTVSPDLNWRILPDGSLWIGHESWPELSTTFDIINRDIAKQQLELGVSTISIIPGVSLLDVGNIGRAEHSILPDQIRSRVWLDIGQEDRGIAASVFAMVRQATTFVDYFAMYQGTVKAQSSDLTTVDLIMDNSDKLAPMGRVPLRHGLPATTVDVSPGAKVLVGWDGGNPQRPYACLWAGGETISAVNLGGSGANGVVTKKDLDSFMFALNAATTLSAADFKASLKSALELSAGWSIGTPDGQCASSKIKAVR